MSEAPPASARDRRGLFISFEGGDGAGKSTQIRRLADVFRDSGREIVTTREPGGSDGAEAIRKLLLEGAADRWSPLAEALMMYAARADHIEKTIAPALACDAVVICDRFIDSTMAYQGLAGSLGVGAVHMLQKLAVNRLPDVTFILDLPVEEGLRRAAASGAEQRFESKGAAYHEKVRQAFLDIARSDPARCAVIDASGPADEVAARILKEARRRVAGAFPA